MATKTSPLARLADEFIRAYEHCEGLELGGQMAGWGNAAYAAFSLARALQRMGKSKDEGVCRQCWEVRPASATSLRPALTVATKLKGANADLAQGPWYSERLYLTDIGVAMGVGYRTAKTNLEKIGALKADDGMYIVNLDIVTKKMTRPTAESIASYLRPARKKRTKTQP